MRRIAAIIIGVLLTASCRAPETAPTQQPAAPSTSTPQLRDPTIGNMPDMPQMPSSDAYDVEGTPIPDAPIAPPIASDTWLNSQPLSWGSLRGRVVLVEFWTFDCINCRHVIPALSGMYDSYKDQGFTLIGVHSPEFQYEHNLASVKDAVREMGIQYPVAIDNDFANWNRYHNLYWPALYLIDKRGVIRFTHIGEGGYDETRNWIEKLVKE